eukprot:2772823-Pyramimonas_sp.AAC.1
MVRLGNTALRKNTAFFCNKHARTHTPRSQRKWDCAASRRDLSGGWPDLTHNCDILLAYGV